MICLNCNRQVEDNANFCRFCGAPLKKVEVPDTPPVTDTAAPFLGDTIKIEKNPETAVNQFPAFQNTMPSGSFAPPQGFPVTEPEQGKKEKKNKKDKKDKNVPVNTGEADVPVKKKGKALKAVIISVAIVLVLALAAGAYIFFFANNRGVTGVWEYSGIALNRDYERIYSTEEINQKYGKDLVVSDDMFFRFDKDNTVMYYLVAPGDVIMPISGTWREDESIENTYYFDSELGGTVTISRVGKYLMMEYKNSITNDYVEGVFVKK